MAYPAKPWTHNQIAEVYPDKFFQYDSDTAVWRRIVEKVYDSDLVSLELGIQAERDSEVLVLETSISNAIADIDSDLYSKTKIVHTKYINIGKNTLSEEVTKSGTAQQIEYVLVAGSHLGGATFSQGSNFLVSGPQTTSGGPIVNFYGEVEISGASTTRARFSNINFVDKVTIDGTVGRHYFKNCTFGGGIEFTGMMTNWVTFEDCSFDGGLTVPITFAGVQYHIRSAFAGSTLTLNNSSPLQLLFVDCVGLISYSVNATLFGNNGLTTGYSRHDVNELYLNGKRVSENIDSEWVLYQIDQNQPTPPDLTALQNADSDLIVRVDALESKTTWTIPGPYTDDSDAGVNGVIIGQVYYQGGGTVHTRLT